MIATDELKNFVEKFSSWEIIPGAEIISQAVISIAKAFAKAILAKPSQVSVSNFHPERTISGVVMLTTSTRSYDFKKDLRLIITEDQKILANFYFPGNPRDLPGGRTDDYVCWGLPDDSGDSPKIFSARELAEEIVRTYNTVRQWSDEGYVQIPVSLPGEITVSKQSLDLQSDCYDSFFLARGSWVSEESIFRTTDGKWWEISEEDAREITPREKKGIRRQLKTGTIRGYVENDRTYPTFSCLPGFPNIFVGELSADCNNDVVAAAAFRGNGYGILRRLMRGDEFRFNSINMPDPLSFPAGSISRFFAENQLLLVERKITGSCLNPRFLLFQIREEGDIGNLVRSFVSPPWRLFRVAAKGKLSLAGMLAKFKREEE